MFPAVAAPTPPVESPPALVAEAPFTSNHVYLGAANPEWIHAGFESRSDQFGFTLSAGTQAMAYGLDLGLRYFLAKTDGGFYGEAGIALMRMFQLSDETPQSWSPSGFVGVGYELVLGHWVADLGVGLPPLPLPTSNNQPIFVTNAQALPRVMLRLGYVL